MKEITQDLLDFALETKYDDLPEPVVLESKRIILDSFAVALAGLSIDKGKIAVSLARRFGGPSEASIIGRGERLSCANAAYANGELIHAMEYCNIIQPLIHVTPGVLAAPLAVAECLGSSGKDLILATALAHEIPTRIGWGMERWRSYLESGPEAGKFVRPAVMGYGMNIFGGTVGAGRLLGLDRDRMAHALGIAGYMCPVPTHGKWIRTRKGGMAKFFPAGWMCHAAVTAAFLAAMDYTGDQTVLDGEYGFWRFYGSSTWNPEEVVNNIGREWRFPGAVKYKEYPSGAIIHGALACFSKVMKENSLAPEDIEEVTVWADALSEMERFVDKEIDTEIDAQFNTAYEIALIAHGIPVDRWQKTDTIHDPGIRAFMQRVVTCVSQDCSKVAVQMFPQSARVEVKARGKTLMEEGIYFKGRLFPDDDYPRDYRQPDEDLIKKFRFHAGQILTVKQVEEAPARVLELEKLEDIRDLMQLVTI